MLYVEGGSFLVEWFGIFTYLCAERSVRTGRVNTVLAKGGVFRKARFQAGKRRKCAFSHCQDDPFFRTEVEVQGPFGANWCLKVGALKVYLEDA